MSIKLQAGYGYTLLGGFEPLPVGLGSLESTEVDLIVA